MSRLVPVALAGAVLGAGLWAAPAADSAVTDVSIVWQRDLAGVTVRESSPLLVDLDANGSPEVVFGGHDRKVWALHATSGQTAAGWPQPVTDRVNSSASAADIDGDGRVELFIGAGTAEAEGGALYSFEHNGALRFRRQAADKVFAAPAVHSTPAIGNIDVTPDINVSFGTLGLLGAWSVSSNGNVRKACPVDVEYPDGACWPFYTDDTVFSSPALADANGDGINDVIIGADSSPGPPVDHQGGFMRAINHNRTAIWEFRTNDIVRSSPSIGNIDGDPGLEVVFGTGDYWGGTDSVKVFALNLESGTLVPGWPKTTDGVTNASPTLADLDGDGVLDVAIGTFTSNHGRGQGGSVYAFRGNGSVIPGFPVASGGGAVLGQIVTADLDGDGGQDLLVPTGALIAAIDGSTGATLFRLAEGANVGFQNSPAVADVDGDGRLDVLAVGTVNTPAGDGRAYRWRLGAEAELGDGGWHQFRFNARRTGTTGSAPAPPAPAPEPEPEPEPAPEPVIPFTRLAGDDRFATAARMSKERSPGTVETAYVATGRAFADALAGGPAADVGGATVLLVDTNDVPSATRTELQRLSPGNIVVFGGRGAVSDRVLAELDALTEGDATRLAGDNRYGTAAAISAATFDPLVPVVYIATGESFADALAGGAAGALHGGPVLLVTRDEIPAETDAELRRLLPQSIVILGGTAAVSAEVEASLQTYTLPIFVSRAAGPDRYATSVAVSEATFPDGADVVHLATGRNFPDALAGGPVAAAGPGPLLLVPGTCLPPSVLDEIERLDPDSLVLLGGSSAVSSALANLTRC